MTDERKLAILLHVFFCKGCKVPVVVDYLRQDAGSGFVVTDQLALCEQGKKL